MSNYIIDTGVNKKPSSVLFRTDSVRTPIYYRQFQKFLLVIDRFRPNNVEIYGHWPRHTRNICAEVTFLVEENIKQAFLRERQIYSPSGILVSSDSYS